MFVINEDNSIYVTRGDAINFTIGADDNGKPYSFQVGDVVRIKVYEKKNCENVVLQKDFAVTEITQKVDIYLSEADTKIGETISKPKVYWYEIELNPFDNPWTIIGYDEDGAKEFRLFPEGEDNEVYQPPVEEIGTVDEELDMTSTRPVQNQAIARKLANILDTCERTNAAVAEKFVTPQMFGAIGDGESDDTNAFLAMFESETNVYIPEGCYFLSETLFLKPGTRIEGANRNTTILKFAYGVNGVQLNHSVHLEKVTISFSGDSAGILLNTPDNENYALSTVVENVRITHESDTNDGWAIKLVAEAVDGKPNGAYNLQFTDIDIRNTVKVGIALLNIAKTTSATECWLTDVKFNNVFVNSAETIIISDWVDASVNGSVPTTGTAPKNSGIYFTNVQAQYVDGLTKCYAKIMNAINVHFVNCFPYDFFHLYPQGVRQFVFNATDKMCQVDLGSCPEVSDIYTGYLSKYIDFKNSSGDFMTDMANVVQYMKLDSTGSIYGKFVNYDKTYQNFFYKPLPMIVDLDKDNAWAKYPELIENGTIRYSGQTSSEFIFGIETETSGCQLIITQSVANAPIPIIKARLKYNGNWYSEKFFSLSDTY